MPRRRTPKQDHLIDMVLSTQQAEKNALTAYHAAQDAHLEAMREARSLGETCENIADALGVSKQWVHKYTTHGRDHNKVYSLKETASVPKTSFSKWG